MSKVAILVSYLGANGPDGCTRVHSPLQGACDCLGSRARRPCPGFQPEEMTGYTLNTAEALSSKVCFWNNPFSATFMTLVPSLSRLGSWEWILLGV